MSKPTIDSNKEAFFPEDELIMQFDPLKINGKFVVNVTQCQAIRQAEQVGLYVPTNGEFTRALLYAKRKSGEQQYRKYLESLRSWEIARYTSTQVHGLTSNCPVVRDIEEVHSEEDVVLRYKKGIIVKWLPKKSGYIHVLDLETGLPTKVEEKPNIDFYNAFYYVEPRKDLVASIRFRGGSWPGLNLYWGPDFVDGGLGVLVAKKFSSGNVSSNLERRVEV